MTVTYDHTAISVRDAHGDRGMVSSGSRYASEAGAQILRDGGNAVDAAVATSLALSVAATPFSGVGGGGFMLVHMASRGESLMIDYRENSPAAAPPDLFRLDPSGAVLDEENHLGAKAPAVPGTFAGMDLALRKFGTMALSRVAGPAVAYGRDGFEITPFLDWVMARSEDLALAKLGRSEEASSIWLKGDGGTYRTGETMYNRLALRCSGERGCPRDWGVLRGSDRLACSRDDRARGRAHARGRPGLLPGCPSHPCTGPNSAICGS